MKVINKNVLLEKVIPERKSGEIIVVNAKPKRLGKVVAISSEIPDYLLKIGDTVSYKEHFDGEEFEQDGKEYIVFNVEAILIIY